MSALAAASNPPNGRDGTVLSKNGERERERKGPRDGPGRRKAGVWVALTWQTQDPEPQAGSWEH